MRGDAGRGLTPGAFVPAGALTIGEWARPPRFSNRCTCSRDRSTQYPAIRPRCRCRKRSDVVQLDCLKKDGPAV